MTQEEYIAILFIDCGYDTASLRKAWMQRNFKKNYADELTVAEKSQAIGFLKDQKAGQNPWSYEER